LFGGNTRLKIYGRLDCPSALRAIKRGPTYARYRVFFADEASSDCCRLSPLWRVHAHSLQQMASSQTEEQSVRATKRQTIRLRTEQKKLKRFPSQNPSLEP
jgi:hypothetical protein